MPLEKCKSGNQPGYKWGSKGKCYLGPDAKKRALKEAYLKVGETEELTKSKLATPEEIEEALTELEDFGPEPETNDEFLNQVAAYISQKVRDKMSPDDFGWPEEKKFPVRNQRDLDAAVKLVGRAPESKQGSIKKRLKEIAKRKGLRLPESWK